MHAYPSQLERDNCAHPEECLKPDIAIIGSAIGTSAASHAIETVEEAGTRPLNVVVLEGGPFDLTGHLGNNPGYPRRSFIEHPERIGGKLMVWGVSTPRPRSFVLDEWPWEREELNSRFNHVETELGVHDTVPMSEKDLEWRLRAQLRDAMPDANVAVAPLAINRHGVRWTPLSRVPQMREAGVSFVSRFRVDSLELDNGRVSGIRGTWYDGRSYLLTPRHVVLGVGAERSIPLLGKLVEGCGRYMRDHHRIDLHGLLPPGTFGRGAPDDLGVAILIVEMEDAIEHRVPFHIEIKVAPVKLWREGYMQSSDNLLPAHADSTIYYQLQVVSAMVDPLPLDGNVLNVGGRIPPVMTARDAVLQGRLVAAALQVARVLGFHSPTFAFREVTRNHHLYAALRVGQEIDEHFRLRGHDNVTVLPPAGYFDHACDANPTLKSLVLTQLAMEHIVLGGAPRSGVHAKAVPR